MCLIDQYLDRRPVPQKQLQLVEVAASCIVATFGEICPSEVLVFVYIMADAYTRDELIELRIGRFRLSPGEVKSPRFEAGDGHKHGYLDAFTIALGSYLDYGE